MSSFVLVHGASHGAWCWKKVVPLLEHEGHTVVAPDLPGQGEDKTPLADVTLKSYTDRVCEVLDAQTESVLLVGHSMNGIVINQAAEYRPEKIKKLVYLTAIIPKNGESALQAMEEVTDQNLLFIAEDQTSYTRKPEAIDDYFYGDCSEEDLAFAKIMLGPQAVNPILEPIHISEEKYGRVPRVYIECLQDKAFPPAFQKKQYAAVPCERVISMDTSHSPFLSAPKALARHLLSLA